MTLVQLQRRNYGWKLLVLFYDTSVAGVCFLLAYLFATNRGFGRIEQWPLASTYLNAAVFALIAGALAWANGQHRAIWRYTSLADAVGLVRTATLTVLIYLPIAFLSTRTDGLPRSVPILAWILMMAAHASPRIAVRALSERSLTLPRLFNGDPKAKSDSIPVVVVGDAMRAEAFIRELQRGEAPYQIVGVLTYGREWHNRRIHGVPVLGGVDNLNQGLAHLTESGIRPQRLVVADDHVGEDQLAVFLEQATKYGLALGKLPRLIDFDGQNHSLSAIDRPVALSDLLGRPQAVLDRAGMRALIAGKRVLVTGAGGSIGSELVRQIADFQPAAITLVDNSEYNLYMIDHELGERFDSIPRRPVLCNVRDEQALRQCFETDKPQIVFHAAALKHVPMVEDNPSEGVRTNVIGTRNVSEACLAHGVEAMVLISTDKAVNPTNIMGASKRMAEAICQAMDAEGWPTRFLAVRFGNVLGSAGSVVPLFQRQLAAGGPLTVTHPDITRYFMSIPEAVQLVLQASALGVGEPVRGAVYVLDMGEPVRIADLAHKMIMLSGKRPNIDIAISYVGLRPGEKLYEEVVHAEEEQSATPCDGVMRISPRTSELAILRHQISELSRAADKVDDLRIRQLMKVAVPELRQELPPRLRDSHGASL